MPMNNTPKRTLLQVLKFALAVGLLAAGVAACTPGQPYMPTADDENRLLYAPEAGL